MKKKYRVKNKKEFNSLIKNGKRVSSKNFILYFKPNSYGFSRYGIAVSKRNGCAVIRNKIKRQIRAILSQFGKNTNFNDFVFVVKSNYKIENFSESKDEIYSLLRKAENSFEKIL